MMQDNGLETYQDEDAEYTFVPLLEGRFSPDDLHLTEWEHDPYTGCGTGGPLLRWRIPMSKDEVEEQRRHLIARRDRADALHRAMALVTSLADHEVGALEDEDVEATSIEEARRRHDTLEALTSAAECACTDAEGALERFEEKASATTEARDLFDLWEANGYNLPDSD